MIENVITDIRHMMMAVVIKLSALAWRRITDCKGALIEEAFQ